jgi:hypothetical protein
MDINGKQDSRRVMIPSANYTVPDNRYEALDNYWYINGTPM